MEWQPIETAPRGEEILLWGTWRHDGEMQRLIGYFHPRFGAWMTVDQQAGGETECEPTHWAPLPSSPIQ